MRISQRIMRRVRGLGYRTGLLGDCIHCDGSINEARERGRPFGGDRWIWHRQHERHLPGPGEVQGPMRTDLPRRPLPEAWLR